MIVASADVLELSARVTDGVELRACATPMSGAHSADLAKTSKVEKTAAKTARKKAARKTAKKR